MKVKTIVEYTCDYCKRSFNRKDNIRTHMLKIHHPVEKNVRYKCKICVHKVKLFKYRSNCVVHLREEHEITKNAGSRLVDSKIDVVVAEVSRRKYLKIQKKT